MTERIQKKLTQMLKVFHEYCVKHGLRYYVIGGTCLGAVRHKGFIPWDDDVDVGMPRKDYNRLLELVKVEKISSPYVVERPLDNKDYIYPFAKMYDTKTTLVEKTAKPLKRGVFLDIFPLDGMADTIQDAKSTFEKVERRVNILHAKVCAFSKRRRFYKNAVIALFRLLPIRKKHTIKKIIQLSEQRDFDQCEYVGNFVGGWHFKEVVKREWLGEPKLYEFDGLQVYGPHDADAYLTNVYGNYMQLPPEEKRVSHHDFIYLDFEKGYLE